MSIRIHSVGGWGAITMGKNLAHDRGGPARTLHQGQPEVRLREEGPADHLLRDAGQGADPAQLRAEARRRRALARPERLPALQPAGRPPGGRRLRHPEQPRAAGPLELAAEERPAARSARSDYRRSTTSTPSSIAMEMATNEDLRYRMQGAAFMGAFFRVSPLMSEHGLDQERLCSRASREQLAEEVRPPRRAGRRTTTCGSSGAASTRSSSSTPSASRTTVRSGMQTP